MRGFLHCAQASRNALFRCGTGWIRCPTAAAIAASWGIPADFAGLSRAADAPLDPAQLAWATLICVTDRRQAKCLQTLHGPHLRHNRLATLNIPDRFSHATPP